MSQYEFATVRSYWLSCVFPISQCCQTMVLSAVIVANLFNGLNTNVWTWWVFFAVSIGIILLLLFTVSFFFLFNCLVSRIESESKNYRQSTMRSRLDGSSPQSGGIIISYGLLRTSGSAYLLPSVSRWHPATSPKHGSLDLPQMTSTSCGTSPKWNPTAMWFVMLNWAVHSRAWRLRLPYHVRIVLPLRRMSGLLWTSAMRAGRICRLGRELLIGALISRLRSRAWRCGAYRLICRNDGRAVGISHYRTNQRIVSWAMCSVCGKPFCGGNFPMNEVFEIFFFPLP